MAEWLLERGIGECRAALVEDGRILAAAIEPDDAGVPVGTVARARLASRGPGGAIVVLDDGSEATVARLPPSISEGAALTVAIIREAIVERGRVKPPRAAVSDAAPAPGPTLAARVAASGVPVRECGAHGPDLLEAAGWSELLEEATGGEIAFPGGQLLMIPTPAMTLFDVDGAPPLDQLACRAATAVGEAIGRHAVGGSIGVDFPTLAGREARQAVAAALDAALEPPFERTAVNGFGFLQIVRPRARMSLPERLRADPTGAAARAALRRLEREPPGAPTAHRLPAPVLAKLARQPRWLAELARRTGVVHRLEPL